MVACHPGLQQAHSKAAALVDRAEAPVDQKVPGVRAETLEMLRAVKGAVLVGLVADRGQDLRAAS